MAASHGEQHGVAVAMTEAIVAFGQTQRARQALAMPQKTIAVAEDETFPEGVWLVAMEPRSGFILLEQAAENREAAAWTTALEAALADLRVTVTVAGGDEAAGLAAHAKEIGAHHAPDVFHVQHPLWQALARPVVASLERPTAVLARASELTAAWRQRWLDHQEGKRSVGRPPDYERHVGAAEAAEAHARVAHDAAVERKEAVYGAIRRLGSAYHPVDPTTGTRRDAATVESELNAAMATLHEAAAALGLSQKRCDLIAKAGRVVPKMVATIAFFYAELGRQLAALNLPEAVRACAEEVLVPATYLARLAERANTVAERAALLDLRQSVLAAADPAILSLLAPYPRDQLQRTVLTCVDLFVRSTFFVEGLERAPRLVAPPPTPALGPATGRPDRHPQLLDPPGRHLHRC